MSKIRNTTAMLVLGIAGALSANANAQDYSNVSNGVSCQPSSTAGMVYTVTQIRNESSNNRTAYCVVGLDDSSSVEYSLFQIVLRNTGDVPRNVTCTAKVGQPFVGYVTVSETVEVPAGGAPVINTMTNIERNTQYAVMGFNCVLPPKVALDLFGAWETPPAP